MRAATTGQAEIALAKQRAEHIRLMVEDSTGAMVDRTEWVVSARLSESLDSFAIALDLRLHREIGSQSSPPLTGAIVAGGRAVEWWVQYTELGDSPAEADWIPLFDGVADDPSWGGDASVVSVPCRSRIAALLHDTWVESPDEYGGDGVAQQDVMQQLLDNVLGEGVVVLDVIGDPDTEVPTYNQSRQSLQDALQALSDVNGWLVRERWHEGAGEFRLTLYEPDREQTVADASFDAEDYWTLSDIQEGSLGVRTVVIIEWQDGLQGVAEDTDAIERFGRRVLYIDARDDDLINSQVRAQSLADLVLTDVSTAIIRQTVEHVQWWRVQLGDVYSYGANDVHYDDTLDVAVYAYEHTWDASPSRPNATLISGRGFPSGGTDRWFIRDERTRQRESLRVPSQSDLPEPGPFGQVTAIVEEDGDLTATLDGISEVASWRVLGGSSPPTLAAVQSATPIDGQSLDDEDVGLLASLSKGDRGFVAAIPYGDVGGGGEEGPLITSSQRFGIDASAEVIDGSVVSDSLVQAAREYKHDIEFVATSPTAIEWSSGTIRFQDGSTRGINAGSLTISQLTYLYRRLDTIGAAIQNTTSLALATGDDRVLLAVARPAPSGAGDAFVVGTNNDSLQINAATANIVHLRSLTADLGFVRAGAMANSANTVGLFLEGSDDETAPDEVPGSWSSYINLGDTSSPWLRFVDESDDLVLQINRSGLSLFRGGLTVSGQFESQRYMTFGVPTITDTLTPSSGTVGLSVADRAETIIGSDGVSFYDVAAVGNPRVARLEFDAGDTFGEVDARMWFRDIDIDPDRLLTIDVTGASFALEGLPTIEPGDIGRVWVDANGFLRLSGL